ncbi:Catenin-beta-like protein [Spinellus fusiger]|nr:Catenin-beta-like protein [Spinellus fusiger]
MPDTPDVMFLDKYREAAEAAEAAEAEAESNTKRRNVTFQDQDTEETAEDIDDDEEGRFFGGGLTDEQSRLLDIVNEFDIDEPEALTLQNVKRIILKFEKAINKNQEQRVRYAEEPEKFMESEADLDEEIKGLLGLTQAPQMYPELVKLGSVVSLMTLLSHENTDIVIDVIDLINELTDEDVGTSEEDLEQSEEAASGLKVLVDALLSNELLNLLVQNLDRLDEKEETDRQGVFKILGIFENIMGVDPSLAEKIALTTEFLPWALKRLQAKEFDSNRGYTSEILSILLQDSRVIRLKMVDLGGVDILLRALSAYKRKDPVDEDETEMVENFFNALCSLLNEAESKPVFLEGEGVELMLIMLKKKTLARVRAIKVLNYALTGEEGKPICVRFVDAMGLKTIFPIFMGKGLKKLKKSYKAFIETEDEEHMVCLFLSLMRNLSPNELQRIRFVRKFIEDDYEKVDHLLEMKEHYEARDHRVLAEIENDKKEMDSEEIEDSIDDFYLRRLEAGLFTLQRVCLILAILAAEDQGIENQIIMLLKRKDQDISNVFSVLEEETALMADFVSLRKVAMGSIEKRPETAQAMEEEKKEDKVDMSVKNGEPMEIVMQNPAEVEDK